MKYIITESQYKLLTEDGILKLDFDVFNNDWNLLQRFLDKKGNPPYKIIGDLDLRGVDVVTLGSLVGVEGYLTLRNNKKIESLGNLQYVGGWLDLSGSNIKSLGNLESVGDSLDLRYTNITSLGNLKSVGGDLRMVSSIVESLENLETVGGSLFMKNSYVLTLNKLKSVGENLDCRNYVLKSLGKLESVGGFLYVQATNIDYLGNLKFVGSNFDLRYTRLSRKTTEEEIRSQVTVGGLIDL